jgi:transcriptional regulator with XRE-family HTH domain
MHKIAAITWLSWRSSEPVRVVRTKQSVGLGRRVLQLRTARNWSQAELARRAGVAPQTLAQIERGTRTPHPATIERLADALRINYWILLLGEDAND